MFVFNPMSQGLELLADRELLKAENLFLHIVNDPYSHKEELSQARIFLKDIRSCQSGDQTLDFDHYRELAKNQIVSFDLISELLRDIYFQPIDSYAEMDSAIEEKIPLIISPLKQAKIRDIIARDELFEQIEKSGLRSIKTRLEHPEGLPAENAKFNSFRWKSICRKFVEQINPILLERHLEFLEYILETGEIELFDDPKLTVLTPKYCWILESTLKIKWYLLRSYFFKAKSEIEDQFNKKEGTRKYWEEVKYKKIKIFESCGFTESNIQKFLYIDKLNYKTLEEIHEHAKSLGLKLIPRDVSLALRGVEKAKDHVKERGGFLLGARKGFQSRLMELGFSNETSYQIARQAKKSNNHQIEEAYLMSLQVAREEIYWYRMPASGKNLKAEVERQCLKHLSTVRIHLFERGRLNKLLLKAGKLLIRKYLMQIYGEEVVSLHCFFRLETIHQYYKLKFYQYHGDRVPSVSELIKSSRRDFQPVVLNGYNEFIKKKRLTIPKDLYDQIANHQSATSWEDSYTTPEEKLLLKFWFLMDHGVSITQRVIDKGVFAPTTDLWGYLKSQSEDCNS